VEAAGSLFRAPLDVTGKVLSLGARALTGGRPRPVIRVVDPATRWIHGVRSFVEREHTAITGCGIVAVDRFGPVECGVAARDVVRMKVRDVAGGIGEDGVVRR